MGKDWNSVEEITLDLHVYQMYSVATLGVWIWEMFITSWFDWAILTGRKKWKWPMALYFTARYGLLLCYILTILDLNTRVKVNCQALIVIIQLVAGIATAAASGMLMLRTFAIWDRSRYIEMPLAIIWLGQLAMWCHSTVSTTNVWSDSPPGCVVTLVRPFFSANYIYTMIFDGIVLLLTSWKLWFRPGSTLRNVRTTERQA
ncbi:hypothetical protein BOTBODRAFT_69257, partial [Botryobasidium botryosum FD-172 SS1]